MAGVYIFKAALTAAENIGHPNRNRSISSQKFALPVADAEKPVSVQRSVCNAAASSARRTPGTANGDSSKTFEKSTQSGFHRVLPPQPTMRTDLDIGAEKSETTMVSDFFYTNFGVEFL